MGNLKNSFAEFFEFISFFGWAYFLVLLNDSKLNFKILEFILLDLLLQKTKQITF